MQLLVDSRGSDVNICDKVSPDIPQLFPTPTVVFGSGGHHLRKCWLFISSRPPPTYFSDFLEHFYHIDTVDTKIAANQKPAFWSRHGHSIPPTILLPLIKAEYATSFLFLVFVNHVLIMTLISEFLFYNTF